MLSNIVNAFFTILIIGYAVYILINRFRKIVQKGCSGCSGCSNKNCQFNHIKYFDDK